MTCRSILFVFLSLICVYSIQATLVSKDKLTMADKKVVKVFSDNHQESSFEKEQVHTYIDSLKRKQAKGIATHVMIEQASDLNKEFASEYRILYKLDKHIQDKAPKLTNVLCDNIEIRHISGIAQDILEHQTPRAYDKYYDYEIANNVNGKKSIGAITFQDIMNEYDYSRECLSQYYSSDESLNEIFLSDIRRCDDDYHMFKNNLSYVPSLDNTVLEYAKKGLVTENSILANNIVGSFSGILSLHILRAIITSTHTHISVFCGCAHAQDIINNIHYRLDASSIYHIDMLDKQAKSQLQENCFTVDLV